MLYAFNFFAALLTASIARMGISAEKGTLNFGLANYWLKDVFAPYRTILSNARVGDPSNMYHLLPLQILTVLS